MLGHTWESFRRTGCAAPSNFIPSRLKSPVTVRKTVKPVMVGGHHEPLTSLEICAGAGGQALGVELAGFEHLALVEIDKHACATLRLNRPHWNVIEKDLNDFDASSYLNKVDLLAGGLPCPPFSVAGKQLGEADERNLFPVALKLVAQCRPRAVMIENVRGLLDAVFLDYREFIKKELSNLGYTTSFKLFNASDFGVSQLRPRVVFVAIRKDLAPAFEWPESLGVTPKTVGELLFPLMSENGWRGAKKWREQASDIAPTIVGGSKKHGGPDLGPTRAKQAWASLGVNGLKLADSAPNRNDVGAPNLTVPMVGLIQGFPPDWKFSGRKTNAYRQVGNAFPPPVARAVAERIAVALRSKASRRRTG